MLAWPVVLGNQAACTSRAPDTVGTLMIVGLASDAAAALLSAFDRIADAPQHALNGTSIGIGSINSGVFARLIGTDLWSVRETIATFRSVARAHVIRQFDSTDRGYANAASAFPPGNALLL